jgi:L-2-hydroxyglutarate oxidase LhgO
MNPFSDYHIVIIGTGVVGLSIARSLANIKIDSVLVIEREETFGRGISSRNSEVIHSGVYYPPNSMKAKYCIRGREKLYEYCKRNNVWHTQCGKLIIGQENQFNELKKLYENGLENGVPEMKLLKKNEIRKLEPIISADSALFVGCTGILSAHELMSSFYNNSVKMNHDYLFKTEVIDCDYLNDMYTVHLRNPQGETETVTSNWVINSGGLQSDIIAEMMNETVFPTLTYSKGCYFTLSSKWKNAFNHLIYPLPDKSKGSLGIHVSFDKDGRIKLGPSAEWLNEKIEDYIVNPYLINSFFKEGKTYINELELSDLTPDYSGIRPKIGTPENPYSDFYINHEINKGFPGFINLIGIESPGLTASIAIGEDVAKWIKDE